MYTPWTLYVFILVLNTLACVSVAFLLARKQFAVGQFAMVLTFVALAFWTFGYAMLLTSTTVEWKTFWLRVENLGIIPQSLFWFIFALQYSTQNKKAPVWLIAALSIAPALSLVCIFSNRWIHLYYPLIERLYPNGGPLKLGHGILYWIMFAQVYLLELAALILLLRRFIGYRNIYRRQMALLITAILFPWVANIYFQLAPRLPLPPALVTPLDVTPLSLALSAALISAAIFGLKLFDLIPIARYRVLEHIPQMVFVVDAEDRVLDINDTGQKWLGKSAEQLIGNLAADVFQKWSELISRYHSKVESREEVYIPGDPARTLEVAIFPIYNRNKLEGRVFVAHDITNRIKLEDDLKRANDALRIQLAEIQVLREKLEEQAIRDPLTGVYNRRFLSDSLDDELAQALKTSTPVSVVILDVDHFKKFNDTHGHKCGDIVLQTLAKFLVNDSRRGDIVCRYGGEEFIVVIPNSSLESAYECAERWRKNFAATLIEFNGQLLSTTFSAGVACFPIHGSTGEAILHAADHALYQSKSKGRNQVNVF
jgi:diguanylate cyclase (GGDEF)-like protein/PAS domain S-box-containing protein